MFKFIVVAAFLALAVASPAPEAKPSPKAKPQFLAYDAAPVVAAPGVAYTSPYAYSGYVAPAVYPSAYSYSPYAGSYVVV